MSKDLKDYIHYYMGRPYWTSNSQGELNAYTLQYVLEMIKGGKEVQLQLRRLEDMTKEEMDEYNGLSSTLFSLVKGVDQIRQESATTHFLLTKGFDVWGLIEIGLAIDAKTLQPQQQ